MPRPLTVLESRLRVFAGAEGYATSFTGHWLNWLIFYEAPAWAFTALYMVFVALVIAVLLILSAALIPKNRQLMQNNRVTFPGYDHAERRQTPDQGFHPDLLPVRPVGAGTELATAFAYTVTTPTPAARRPSC